VGGDVRDDPARRLNRAGARARAVRETGFVVARVDGSVRDLVPNSITAAQGDALADWVEREGAVATVETGLGYGIAALYVCEALLVGGGPDARHVAVDPYQTTRCASVGLQVLEEAGLDHLLELHEEESELVLPRFVSEGRRFDLAVVDGNHRFDGVFLDLVYLGRLVRGGGIVFVDDLQLPAVERAVRFCTTNLGWTVEQESRDEPLHNWAVLRTPETPPERRFDDYVEF
jgi:predicted O-methyltransferase YrrM